MSLNGNQANRNRSVEGVAATSVPPVGWGRGAIEHSVRHRTDTPYLLCQGCSAKNPMRSRLLLEDEKSDSYLGPRLESTAQIVWAPNLVCLL